MCRSIKTLRGAETVTEEEVHAAALQFVRKVSGYRAPSAANQAAFEAAVGRVGGATRQLLDELAPPRSTVRAAPSARTSRSASPRPARPAARA